MKQSKPRLFGFLRQLDAKGDIKDVNKEEFKKVLDEINYDLGPKIDAHRIASCNSEHHGGRIFLAA